MNETETLTQLRIEVARIEETIKRIEGRLQSAEGDIGAVDKKTYEHHIRLNDYDVRWVIQDKDLGALKLQVDRLSKQIDLELANISKVRSLATQMSERWKLLITMGLGLIATIQILWPKAFAAIGESLKEFLR